MYWREVVSLFASQHSQHRCGFGEAPSDFHIPLTRPEFPQVGATGRTAQRWGSVGTPGPVIGHGSYARVREGRHRRKRRKRAAESRKISQVDRSTERPLP